MTPTKFQHAGLNWIPHTPGDPMPCPGNTLVKVLLECGTHIKDRGNTADNIDWSNEGYLEDRVVVGWHPLKEQPDPAITGRCRGRCSYHTHEYSAGWPIAEKCKAWDEDKDGPEPYYLRGAAQCKPATRLGRKPGY